MATFQATTASNWPRVNSEAVETVESIIDDYDFIGNWDELTVAVRDQESDEPRLTLYGYTSFDPSKPILDEDGSVVDREYGCSEEFLQRLAPHLYDPLVVETVGYEKCRFPLLAGQWAVWPDGTVAYDSFDHSPEKPATDTSNDSTDDSEASEAEGSTANNEPGSAA